MKIGHQKAFFYIFDTFYTQIFIFSLIKTMINEAPKKIADTHTYIYGKIS